MNRRDLVALLGLASIGRAAAAPGGLPPLPTASEAWLNGAPLTPERITGRPVLIEFWTFGCGNCRNTLPWMKAAYARFAPRGLVVIAVHTPEFPAERDPHAVAAAVVRLGIAYPVVLDPQGAIWAALDNRYWPAFHLFDRRARPVTTAIGELHAGTARAAAFEAAIERVLAAS